MATYGRKQNNPSICFSSFNEAQDVLLCKAWSNTMTDAKIAINQKSDAFRVKLHKYWLRHKGANHPIRTPVELMQRFSLIKTAMDKFAGYIAQVRYFSNKLGTDEVTLAKKMYSELEGMENTGKSGRRKPTFNFEHCWNVLKYEQLWLRPIKEGLRVSKAPVNRPVHDRSKRGVYDLSSKPVVAEKRKANFVYDIKLSQKRIDMSHDSTPLYNKQGENASGDASGKGKRPIEEKSTQVSVKGGSQNPIVLD